MGQRTDASVVLRLGYQAIRRAGLPTEDILTKAGVALNQVETNDRTPLSAQYAFWVAAEEVSKDPDIGLHLGEHLPLYRGQVIEHLFISSENFGEGLKRALAYQRLISDAFHAKLVLEAMAYQVAKTIGGAATVLHGKVDVIIITGGIANNKFVLDYIVPMISFISNVLIFPGEDEMKALNENALGVLTGERHLSEYK